MYKSACSQMPKSKPRAYTRVGCLTSPSVLDISSLYGLLITLCLSWSSDVQLVARAQMPNAKPRAVTRAPNMYLSGVPTPTTAVHTLTPRQPHPLALPGVSANLESSSCAPYSLHTRTRGGDHRVVIFDLGAGRCYSIHLSSTECMRASS